MSPILLSTETEAEPTEFACRLANRVARYRASGDAVDRQSLVGALVEAGFPAEAIETYLDEAMHAAGIAGEGAP